MTHFWFSHSICFNCPFSCACPCSNSDSNETDRSLIERHDSMQSAMRALLESSQEGFALEGRLHRRFADLYGCLPNGGRQRERHFGPAVARYADERGCDPHHGVTTNRHGRGHRCANCTRRPCGGSHRARASARESEDSPPPFVETRA